jgi:hypothetical protein
MTLLENRVGRVLSYIYTIDMITDAYTIEQLWADQEALTDAVYQAVSFEHLPKHYQNLVLKAEKEYFADNGK